MIDLETIRDDIAIYAYLILANLWMTTDDDWLVVAFYLGMSVLILCVGKWRRACTQARW